MRPVRAPDRRPRRPGACRWSSQIQPPPQDESPLARPRRQALRGLGRVHQPEAVGACAVGAEANWHAEQLQQAGVEDRVALPLAGYGVVGDRSAAVAQQSELAHVSSVACASSALSLSAPAACSSSSGRSPRATSERSTAARCSLTCVWKRRPALARQRATRRAACGRSRPPGSRSRATDGPAGRARAPTGSRAAASRMRRMPRFAIRVAGVVADHAQHAADAGIARRLGHGVEPGVRARAGIDHRGEAAAQRLERGELGREVGRVAHRARLPSAPRCG